MTSNIKSRSFIIEFLEMIDQPLSDYEVNKILMAEKYLDELLKEQQEAITQMLNEEF